MTIDTQNRLDYPATGRNRGPIVEILRDVVPSSGVVLEIASGSGQHVVYFSTQFQDLEWQPSDCDPEALKSIDAWRKLELVQNVKPALFLDVNREDWPTTIVKSVKKVDLILNINMIHISPWSATQSLFAGAGKLLESGHKLFFYGPFFEQGVVAAESNKAFDRSLRSRNPEWGIRNLEEVARLANDNGLQLLRKVSMPANNLSIIFERQDSN